MKTASVATTTSPAMVSYKVVVRNEKAAGPAYNGLLTDTLYSPDGKVMFTRSWDLETVVPGDLITLTYDVAYGTTTMPGLYKNVAKLTAMMGSESPAFGVVMPVVQATSSVYVISNGSVLGVSTSTPSISKSSLTTGSEGGGSCTPLLSTFMRRNSRTNNLAEVRTLQIFLNENLGLTMPTTGFFGAMTENAVRSFQLKHKDEILTPHKLTRPTGNVLSSTQAKINSVACKGAPLAAASTGPVLASAPATSPTTPIAPTPKKNPVATAKKKAPTKPSADVAAAAASEAPVLPVSPVQKEAPKKGISSWLKNVFSTTTGN